MKIEDITPTMTMQTSLSFDTHHVLTYKAKFDCPGLSIHDKEFWLVITTPKNKNKEFTTPRNQFYLSEQPEQKFSNLRDLVLNYCKNELE